MSHFFGRFLVTLVLLTALVVTTGGAAYAAPGPSMIPTQDEPFIGDHSGEPDVGQTSPTGSGRVQGKNAVVQETRFDAVLRLSVWLWKARHGLTGF